MKSVSIQLRRLAAIVALGALGLAQAQTQGHEGVTLHSLVIGQSLALSGAAAATARPYHQGAKLYFDQLNAAGGIHGRRIELLTMDDGGEPAAAAANTQKMLDQGVLCLFGYYGAPQVAAGYALARTSGVLMFAPLTAAEELRGEQFPHLYALRPDYGQEAKVIARHAEMLGAHKLAVLYSGDAEALAALDSAQRKLPQLGAALVAAAPISGSGVQRVVAAAPEAVLIVAGASEAADAVRQLRAKGFHRQIYTFSMAGESLLADELGPEGRGVVLARVVPGSESQRIAVVREMAAGAAAGHLGRPNVFMMEGYIAADVLAQALQQASAHPSRAKLRLALEKLHDFDVGGFQVSYTKDRVASRVVELALMDSQGRIRD